MSRALALLLLLAACGTDPVPGLTRETRPDGRVVVTYAAGLPAQEDTLVPLFTIGKYFDDSSAIFGSLFDIDVSPSGEIYALDVRPTELIVFDATGARTGTVGRRGDGPGEFSRSNGIHLGADGTIWVNDYGKRMVLALDPDGTERGRYPQLTPGTGLGWDVVIDSSGVLWELKLRRLTDATTMGINGLFETPMDRQLFSFDPATGTRDSVGVAPWTAQQYGISFNDGNNQIVTELPFSGPDLTVMDRRHQVWVSSPAGYPLTRVNLSGDTTLELRVADPALSVGEDDIAKWQEQWAGLEEEVPGVTARLQAYLPETRPLVTELFVDDHERLWVGRTVHRGDPARWDVYTPDGDFIARIRAPVGTTGGLQPVIRGNRIYLRPEGEAGERYIVVAELPEVLR